MAKDTKKWMTELSKDFGKIASHIPSPSKSTIKMPSPSLNWAIGNGGLVLGKALCFYGPESSGKSLLMQLTMIEIQRQDPDCICVLFDAEYAFNRDWFEKLGGDLDRLLVRQSNDPVQIFDYIKGEMLEKIQEGCPIKAIAIDSVKSILYPKDMKKKTTDQTMGGGGASYLGSALKHIVPVIRDNNITCLLVQQVYEEMDQYKQMRNPYKVPDGRALKHFCDYMAQVDKMETKAGVVESGETITGSAAQVGHKVTVKFKKNRVAAPYRTAQFTLNYARGIVDIGLEIFELAKSLGVIYHPKNSETGKVNTSMWKLDGFEQIHGEDNMKTFIVKNSDAQHRAIELCNIANDEAVSVRNELFKSDTDANLDDDFDPDLV